MRTYTPHQHDANAAREVLDASAAGRIDLTPDQFAACELVEYAFKSGADVTQNCINRCHDAVVVLRASG